ncbi:MAG TPA: glycosyltransferase family 39 protein [Acidiferrobacterales bacterium]|jgi:4-amino-4-deoxy-L-arabinose transferase-like glycosyltransferase
MFGQRKKPPTRRSQTAPRHDRDAAARQARKLEQFIVEEIELSGDVRQATGGYRATGGRARKPPPAWLPAVRLIAGVTGLWLLLVLASLFSRGLWPSDETRFAGLAWEMWLRGDWLVPTLNGEPATRQAPLALWAVVAGWKLTGVNDWWPRLVPALFSLGSAFLCMGVARFLWPGQREVARYAPLILFGSFFWAAYTTYAVADMALVFCTLLSVYALLWMWRARDNRVWLLLGVALGLGLLAQGWRILLYVLPVALLAPLWARTTPRPRWGYWYADLAKATALGLVVFSAWAVPAAMRAGLPYGLGVLTAPLSASVYEFIPPQQPWWWYLFLLPIAALPWSVWPFTWMRLWDIRRRELPPGMLFCMVWAVSVLALLSLASVKQPHFLLPIAAAFALPVAWLLFDESMEDERHDSPLSSMVLPIMLVGGLLAVLPKLPRIEVLPDFLWELSPLVGVAVLLVGMAVGWLPITETRPRVANIAAAVITLSTLALLALGWQFNGIYTVAEPAAALARAEAERRPIAHVGPYDGQYQFAGRLTRPIAVIDAAQIELWMAEHPQGLVVTYTRAWQPAVGAGVVPAAEYVYGDGGVRLWDARAVAAAPASLSTWRGPAE